MMEILKSVEDLKAMVLQRNDLVSERKFLSDRVQDGCRFFEQVTPRTSHKDVKEASALMNQYAVQIQEIDRQIFELDTVICSRLEAEFLDSVIRIRTRKTVNEAGDVVPAGDFFFMPKDYAAGAYCTVDENDLWFLKIVKAAFSLQNVEVIKKETQI